MIERKLKKEWIQRNLNLYISFNCLCILKFEYVYLHNFVYVKAAHNEPTNDH